MTETHPHSRFSVSDGTDDVDEGDLLSRAAVSEFLKRYAAEHGHDEAMALTVWELPDDESAGTPHAAAAFISQ